MRRPRSIRPGVDGLEPRMLLASAAGSAAVGPHATAVDLRGTIRGVGSLIRTSINVRGAGDLGRVGRATLLDNFDLLDPPRNVLIQTPRGALILAITSAPVVSGDAATVTYSIAGGTRAYAHATGSGMLTGSYTTYPHQKIAFTARFS